ncbi:Tn3 family transposase, partial [Chroococcidiopsis cubana CCALA 043]
MRIFLPKLLETIEFSGTETSVPILSAWEFLRSIEGKVRPELSVAPLALVNKGWARLVIEANGEINRKAYSFCVLQCLRAALRRRDVFAAKSSRYCDPRAKLLQGAAWES